MIRAVENDLRILTDNKQAKLDDLERINSELRQSERRRERLRLDKNKEQQQVELKRRAYN